MIWLIGICLGIELVLCYIIYQQQETLKYHREIWKLHGDWLTSTSQYTKHLGDMCERLSTLKAELNQRHTDYLKRLRFVEDRIAQIEPSKNHTEAHEKELGEEMRVVK